MLAVDQATVIVPIFIALIGGIPGTIALWVTYRKNVQDGSLAEKKIVIEERSVAATEIDKAIPGFSLLIETQRQSIEELNVKVDELENDRTKDRMEMGRLVMEAAELRGQLVRVKDHLANETARREASERRVEALQQELGGAKGRIAELEARHE